MNHHRRPFIHTQNLHDAFIFQIKVNLDFYLDLLAHWLYSEIVPDVHPHLHLVPDLEDHVMPLPTEKFKEKITHKKK